MILFNVINSVVSADAAKECLIGMNTSILGLSLSKGYRIGSRTITCERPMGRDCGITRERSERGIS